MPLLLTRADLRPAMTDFAFLRGAMDAVEIAFREHYQGEADHYDGTAVPLAQPRSQVRVLPGLSPAHGVSVRMNPIAPGARTQRNAHLTLLLDPVTGELQALMGSEDLNVVRTAAPAGVAARYLAPRDAAVVAMIGSGRQARGQLLALRAALPSLREARVYSPRSEHREAFANELSGPAGIPIEVVDSAEEAIAGADVVGVATSSRRPVFDAAAVGQGALIISIADGQLPPALIARSRVIAVSRRQLIDTERQPYAAMIADGSWSADAIAAELAEVMLGEVEARSDRPEPVLFEMPGLSLWDAAVAAWALRWARDNGLGAPLDLTGE